MNKNQETCSVCLQTDPDCRKITEDDEGPIIEKLSSFVPEIDWKANYVICIACNLELRLIHRFRHKCLQSDILRKEKPPSSPEPPGEPQNSNEAPKTVKAFACPRCDRRFGRSSTLTQHLKYHEHTRSFVCAYCGKSFVTKTDLNIHEKIHLNQREYGCDGCPKSFNTPKDLRTHKFVVHTDPSRWQYVCEVCSKRFPVKSNHDAHVRRHKDERPFACHLCPKRFVAKCTLQKHFRAHSNIRLFTCNVCGKEYKDKRVMDVHKAKIHGVGNVKVPDRVKRHFCHVCPKGYVEKNKLTNHLRKHTGERPFSCKICEKTFSVKPYLLQHLKRVHNFVENCD